MSLAFFQKLVLPGTFLRCASTLPADACVRAVVFDTERSGFWLLIESHTFDDIPEGSVLPELTITVTRVEEPGT